MEEEVAGGGSTEIRGGRFGTRCKSEVVGCADAWRSDRGAARLSRSLVEKHGSDAHHQDALHLVLEEEA